MASETSPADRRAGAERRNVASRRRHAESRTVHVELCHSVLRVATVVHDSAEELPQLTTSTVRWRHDAADLASDQGRAELAAALRQLVSDRRLAGCAVSFAISSTLCVNRATTGATAKVETELTALKDRSQHYLSLGPGPKTTAVGRKPIDARHEHAMITVANARTIELLVSAAETAGLVVDTIESSLVALSRLHGQHEPDRGAATVLAQLDENRFEIGVSLDGQLLVEYRPSAQTTVAELGELVDGHHDRLVRFCGRQYGLGTPKIERMWLVGEPCEVSETNAGTKTKLRTGVLPLAMVDRFFRREESDTTAEMGAALGLALRGRVDETGVSPNLMQEIHARAKAPLRPFLIRAGAPIAAALAIAAGLWALNFEQRVELSVMRSRVAELAPVQLRGKRLASELHLAADEIKHLAHLAERTPKRSLDSLVERVGHCLPEDVWLKSLRFGENNQAVIAGASYTEGGVYDFVRHLGEAPGVGEVALRGTGVDQTANGPATSFDLNFELAPLANEEPEQ
ncbi:MAG: PilN domain-containing protein [Planctomycetota bacterium]